MEIQRPAAVIVLAAGEGRGMHSRTAKVVHRIGGRSLLEHSLAAARALAPDDLVVVVRHQREQVAEHITAVDPKALIADQDEVPGTGRAVSCGLAALASSLSGSLTGTVVVTHADVPLLTGDTLVDLVRLHQEASAAVTVLTAEVPDPTGYGRVLRDALGEVIGIVEHREADPDQRAVREINSGVYAFDAALLVEALDRINAGNQGANGQMEQYLTDVVGIARADGRHVQALRTDDLWQVEAVNDRVELAGVGAELNRRLLTAWMRSGVTVIDPATTWVDVDVQLDADVTLLPGVHLLAGTTVATGAQVGPDTTLSGCWVGEGASVVRTHGSGARIEAGATVGPFSYLRPGTVLGAGGKIGAFVESKDAVIGAGSKVPHLTYVGDATIGTGTNIGAATIFANYDGVHKHHTTIGDHVRIGSDTILVAPVSVGDGAYTAAGSAIYEDVPAGSLGIARGKQHNSEGWVEKHRPGTPSAEAAERARTAGESPAP